MYLYISSKNLTSFFGRGGGRNREYLQRNEHLPQIQIFKPYYLIPLTFDILSYEFNQIVK